MGVPDTDVSALPCGREKNAREEIATAMQRIIVTRIAVFSFLPTHIRMALSIIKGLLS
jgi:hypothetical protein